MSYHHQFTGRTEGIRPTALVRWRSLDGLMGAFWEAEGDAGGHGYYLSANPRISIFFTDVSSIRMANQNSTDWRPGRPMSRALYVPAGMPMWTSFTSSLSFSHLDIHLNPDRAVKFLTPALGRRAAKEALSRPAELHETRDIEILARLLVDEITTPTRHSLYAESLAGILIAGVLDLDGTRTDRAEGRLTLSQMRKIVANFETGGGRRLTVAEMAETVNLSESWFSTVFKSTTGITPLQWQLKQRIDLAQNLLTDDALSIAEIANRLGFSDQAHLTKVFRQFAGETPAAWRRAHQSD
ncbi:MAG: AraC family transcriptional regulator [Paracoccaceae bacterium]